MGTPGDVIELSALYMKIYFMGMPFFMLYNYGAAILRAIGDTKRPLLFLIIAGGINVCLNLLLVIVFHLGVAGVAIGTVISQLVSSVLVLWCLWRAEGSYQLRVSKLKIQKTHLKQIFQIGIPAGIQSMVINFSNVLLQSSVNSFGSVAMAGYTAANNIFGFLYASANSVSQACMSFTSQNYGVGKWKRMDRVLVGLHDPYDRGDAGIRRGRVCIWSSASWNLHLRCRGDSVRNGDPPVYDGPIFCVD